MMARPKDSAPPLPRRFYQAVTVEAVAGGWRIALDGRGVKTPLRADLLLPSAPLAERVAAEWRAQGARVAPHTMPTTRLANTALDRVAGREAEIVAEIMGFAGGDLICYRAHEPQGLVAEQRRHWDPVVDWARDSLAAPLSVVEGIVHHPQPAASLARLGALFAGYDAFALTALHTMTTLTGSALLPLAHVRGLLSLEAAWRAAHVDEDWQISVWGEDAEAAAGRRRRREEMVVAGDFFRLAANNAA